MSALSPPMCRLCHKEHWAREGCQFITKPTKGAIERNVRTSSATKCSCPVIIATYTPKKAKKKGKKKC